MNVVPVHWQDASGRAVKNVKGIAMLVLTMKSFAFGTDEFIDVAGPCRIKIVEIRAASVRVGIEADKSVAILRGKLTPMASDAESQK